MTGLPARIEQARAHHLRTIEERDLACAARDAAFEAERLAYERLGELINAADDAEIHPN